MGIQLAWIFMGDGAHQPSALFSSRADAESWISVAGVSGMLTGYPIDVSVYDWAIKQGHFSPKESYQQTPRFISRFSSAYLEHYHYVDGTREA